MAKKTDQDQLSFDFLDDFTDNPAEKQFFDSEDDLLAVVTTSVDNETDTILPADDDSKIISAGVFEDCVATSQEEDDSDTILESAEDAEKELVSLGMILPGAIPQTTSTARVIHEQETSETTIDIPNEDSETEIADQTIEKVVEIHEKRRLKLTDKTITRAALAFLASLKVDGAAVRVPTALSRVKADAAAFILQAGKHTPSVYCTIIAQTCMERSKCVTNRAELEILEGNLDAENVIRESIEAELRLNEPELCDCSLFPESASWNYTATRNRQYHACLKRIGKIESALEHSSFPARLAAEQKASEFYLVTPENLVTADEICPDWGLVYVKDDMSFRVIREAAFHECSQDALTAFCLRIAASSTNDILFANGININDSGEVELRPIPKRRRSK